MNFIPPWKLLFNQEYEIKYILWLANLWHNIYQVKSGCSNGHNITYLPPKFRLVLPVVHCNSKKCLAAKMALISTKVSTMSLGVEYLCNYRGSVAWSCPQVVPRCFEYEYSEQVHHRSTMHYEDDCGDHELRRGSHGIDDNSKEEGTLSTQNMRAIRS